MPNTLANRMQAESEFYHVKKTEEPDFQKEPKSNNQKAQI